MCKQESSLWESCATRTMTDASHDRRRYAPPGSPPIGKWRRLLPVTTILLLPACSASSISVGQQSRPTPAALMRSSIQAASDSGSVHYLMTTPLEDGAGRTTGNVTSASGQQWIVDPDGGAVETRLVGSTAYFRGNVAGLTGIGFDPSTAAHFAKQWVELEQSSPLFAAATDEVTLGSVLQYVTPTGTLDEEVNGQFVGQPAIEISGAKPLALIGDSRADGRTILYLDPSDAHLPLGFDYATTRADGSESMVRWRFSRWGEVVSVLAPRHASSPVEISGGHRPSRAAHS